MCGFVGVIGTTQPDSVLRKMLCSIPHSGPHEFSYVRGQNSQLGCSWILDNRRASLSSSQRTSVAFFGEIYACEALRPRPSEDYRGPAATPAELLLDGYGDFEDTHRFGNIDGAYSVAAIDETRRTCMLRTDQFGISPPFYASSGDAFIFSSHINPLFLYPGFSTEMDRVALLETKVLHSHEVGRTFFQAVKQLVPGFLLEVSLDGDRTIVSRPCTTTAEINRQMGQKLRPQDWVQHLEERLSSILLRLNNSAAGSPVALAFSGGIDSTLLAALMARQCTNLTCHTLCDSEDIGDDYYSREFGTLLHLRHQTHKVLPSEFLAGLPSLIWTGGCHGPVFTPYYLARRIQQDLPMQRVLLCGEGAEDYLGGGVAANPFLPSLQQVSRTLGRANIPEVRDSGLFSWLINRFAGQDSTTLEPSELLELARRFESGSLYSFRAGADACGIQCAFPYVDRDLVTAAMDVPVRLKRLRHSPNLIPRILLTRALRACGYARPDLVKRRKEPLFFALSQNLLALGYSLKELLPASFYSSFFVRYSRNVVDLFWIWALAVVFLKYKGRVDGMEYHDLIREVQRAEEAGGA